MKYRVVRELRGGVGANLVPPPTISFVRSRVSARGRLNEIFFFDLSASIGESFLKKYSAYCSRGARILRAVYHQALHYSRQTNVKPAARNERKRNNYLT